MEYGRYTDDRESTETAPPEMVQSLDTSLRPKVLNEYIGQSAIKKNLHLTLTAAKQRGEPAEHILFSGPPGLGKTTLAGIVASELGMPFRITSGPALERSGDLASIIASLQPGEVLFIDEIHRLNRAIEEMLYPAMEDYALDLILGKGAGARTMRIQLPQFTLVGATTRPGALSSPLRDRFGLQYHLDYYTHDELAQIIERSARLLEITVEDKAAMALAQRSRGTPRVANRLVKRVRDYATVHGDGVVRHTDVNTALSDLGIDELGLDSVDRRVLTTIIEQFDGGPVGIEAIAASTSIERATLEDVYEPYLLQIGFLQRTPRGRKTSQSAIDYLGL